MKSPCLSRSPGLTVSYQMSLMLIVGEATLVEFDVWGRQCGSVGPSSSTSSVKRISAAGEARRRHHEDVRHRHPAPGEQARNSSRFSGSRPITAFGRPPESPWGSLPYGFSIESAPRASYHKWVSRVRTASSVSAVLCGLAIGAGKRGPVCHDRRVKKIILPR